MFAVQKEKKAKEAKENDGKNAHTNDANQRNGAMEHRNPQILIDGMNYGVHPNGGWPVDNGVQSGYNPAALSMYHDYKTPGLLPIFCLVC